MFSMDTLDREMIHVPGGMQWDEGRFNHTIQNSAQFKTDELFTSGIFLLIFSDHGSPQITEVTDNKQWKVKLWIRGTTVIK